MQWVDPMQTLTIQAMMSCLGDRFTFEQADEMEESQEQKAEEERLEVTEACESGDPTQIGKEV